MILGLLFLSGCEELSNQGSNKNRVYIKNDNDDGYVAVLTDSIPDFSGYITVKSDQQLIVGLFTSGFLPDGEPLTSRGIFRFDISEWNETDITFNLKCIDIAGNPGELKVYLTDELDPLLNQSEIEDVSAIWNLIESSGREITELIPQVNEWMNITISKNTVSEMYLGKDNMTIMLKLSDENIDSNTNYYGFASVDYTPSVKNDKPYLFYVQG
jgi:hypothetical protein